MNLIPDLSSRGLIAQSNHLDELAAFAARERVCLYTGFDPTADSLHVGHLLPLMNLARAQRAGCRVIALLGGATALIGDPTGKTEMRAMLEGEAIRNNMAAMKRQMGIFLDLSGDALVVDNAEWLGELNYLRLLREVGAHFSVNRMLTADCFRARMEKGLSFLEFNYMVLQAYDFLELARRHGCLLQMGGDDQWSNMLAGVELIRRLLDRQAFVLTNPLLTTSDGRKMGKTEKGAVWLSADKTPPYEYFQYWRNIPDDRVQTCLAYFTFLPVEEVAAVCAGDINRAKERLALETTALLHGRAAAEEALAQAKAAFGGGGEGMPTVTLPAAECGEGLSVVELLRRAGLAPSNKEARRLVEGGGVQLGEERVSDPMQVVSRERLASGVELRKGKKQRLRVVAG